MKEEKKDSELEELEKKLDECRKLKDEYLASWQRERADFLNYQKEELERMGELIKYGNLSLILKILPILDSFEITENKLPEDLKNNENIKGILQVKNQILDFLKTQGVEEVKAMGEKFDPNFHEIVGEVVPSDLSAVAFLSTEASAKAEAEGGALAKAEASAKEGEFCEPGIIIEEIQKGYKIHERLLRPAKVKVRK